MPSAVKDVQSDSQMGTLLKLLNELKTLLNQNQQNNDFIPNHTIQNESQVNKDFVEEPEKCIPTLFSKKQQNDNIAGEPNNKISTKNQQKIDIVEKAVEDHCNTDINQLNNDSLKESKNLASSWNQGNSTYYEESKNILNQAQQHENAANLAEEKETTKESQNHVPPKGRNLTSSTIEKSPSSRHELPKGYQLDVDMSSPCCPKIEYISESANKKTKKTIKEYVKRKESESLHCKETLENYSTRNSSPSPRQLPTCTTPICTRRLRQSLSSPGGSPANSSPAVIKRNAKGETPLHVATIKGNISRVRELLADGVNPNVKDNAGWTPLHEACNHGHKQIVEVLLDHGAFINVPGLDNDTPLHDSVNNMRLEIVELLVTRGADIHARNLYGYTPLDVAKTREVRDFLERCFQKAPVTTYENNLMVCNEQPEQLVLLGTGLNNIQKTQLQKCASLLKGSLASNFSSDVSHIVVACNKNGYCQRTLKYLHGVLTGKWIVTFQWVEVCLEDKQRVAEEGFEVPGTTNQPNSNGATRGRLNKQKQLPSLFVGCHFYFHGNFVSPCPPKEDLIALVKEGGGVVLTREPRPEVLEMEKPTVPYHAAPSSDLSSVSYFIVSQNTTTGYRYNLKSPLICHVSCFWLLDCIGAFEILGVDGIIKNQ
ncbi:BRCA1-associated RING domain protein 1-like isoform X2 [Limulus polyphemus]|nr:BRCA1-associated RING domain protein 1-like isoform X2 [Limulus polyphemus]XP_022240477.1 BRCA1-associated RING domain protein 1-like isoform X2 [Limulus polyphemus]